jgi:hypothetical protein
VPGIVPVLMTSASADASLFSDGFESGDTMLWSGTVP